MLAKFEFHKVKVHAKNVRYKKHYKGDKGHEVTHSDGVQIGHSLYDAGMEKIYERSSEVQYVCDKEHCFANNVVRFEQEGEDLEEEQGPSKLARQAGIEDDNGDA